MENLSFDLWVKNILTPPLKYARKRAPKIVLAALIFWFQKNESFSCVRKLPLALTILNTQRSPQVGWLLSMHLKCLCQKPANETFEKRIFAPNFCGGDEESLRNTPWFWVTPCKIASEHFRLYKVDSPLIHTFWILVVWSRLFKDFYPERAPHN